MKCRWIIAVVPCLLSLGCLQDWDLNLGWKLTETPPPVVQEDPASAHKDRPITADQIREENAKDKANMLRLEMERDEQGGLQIDAAADVHLQKK